MKIDHNNCEAFFLDYYEGNLSKEGVEELFAFLNLNPEMREVFDSYDEVSFSPDKQVYFEGKDELKKTVEFFGTINESNYEEYFVSDVEGLLKEEERAELEKFLVANPDKREELELLRNAILEPDTTIVFEEKAALKKSVLVTAENFEEMAIASVEGLLNAEEKNALAASLAANETQQKEFALYAQTKLQADASIVFEDKAALKKNENDRGIFWWMTDIRFAAAAAVILFMGIFFWNYSGNKNDVKEGKSLVAKTDTSSKANPGITIAPKEQMATNGVNNDLPKVNDSNATKIRKEQIAKIENVPAPSVKEKTPFDVVAFNGTIPMIKASYHPQVDFSGTYYDASANYQGNNPMAQSSSLTPGQYAMRWMKKKLDHTSANPDEDEVQKSYAKNQNPNGDVTGFDLTSSAINRIGIATGANLHLGKENEGTILTIGKYRVLLNHKK